MLCLFLCFLLGLLLGLLLELGLQFALYPRRLSGLSCVAWGHSEAVDVWALWL